MVQTRLQSLLTAADARVKHHIGAACVFRVEAQKLEHQSQVSGAGYKDLLLDLSKDFTQYKLWNIRLAAELAAWRSQLARDSKLAEPPVPDTLADPLYVPESMAPGTENFTAAILIDEFTKMVDGC